MLGTQCLKFLHGNFQNISDNPRKIATFYSLYDIHRYWKN
jgi:hypothetical protein